MGRSTQPPPARRVLIYPLPGVTRTLYSMVQPAVRILNADEAADAARALETPTEVRQFQALATESPSVREFLQTPEWAAIYERIMGDGSPPMSRPKNLGDVSRFFRWTADGYLKSGPVSEGARAAYLHCASEVDTFARSARRAAPVSPAAHGVRAGAEAGLSFGDALAALKAGRRVTRASWPGGYVTAQAGYPQGIGINANTAAATGLPVGTTAVFGPYLMKVVTPFADAPPECGPWTPDHRDLFADDWRVVDG